VSCLSSSHLIFESDPDWQVNHYAIGDGNNDGSIEFILGFWRVGDYGVDIPYAKSRRDPLPGYHLYLYQYQPDSHNFRLIWGSSTLNDPLYSFTVKPSLNTDNLPANLLFVETGSYSDFDDLGQIFPTGKSDWIWNNWWFSKLD